MGPNIRPLVAADRKRWEEMFAGYARFYETEMSTAEVAAVWGWIFDAGNDFWCDVVEDAGGALSGFVQYQLMHRSLGGNMTCYMSDLWVDPGMRGAGTGGALIDHVLAFATARGLPGVRWLTQDFNYPARMVYDRYARRTDFILYNVPV